MTGGGTGLVTDDTSMRQVVLGYMLPVAFIEWLHIYFINKSANFLTTASRQYAFDIYRI